MAPISCVVGRHRHPQRKDISVYFHMLQADVHLRSMKRVWALFGFPGITTEADRKNPEEKPLFNVEGTRLNEFVSLRSPRFV